MTTRNKAHAATDTSEERILLSLDDYLKGSAKHYGLVASFKREALDKPEMMEPKTAEDWDSAFAEQSSRTYK